MKVFFRRALIAIFVIGALGAAGLMCQRVSARGRYASEYSTYGAGPEGTRGLFLLTEELGARPVRWAEELGRLPEGGMLVALGDCGQFMRRPMGRIERENLRGWVERGGVLVVAGVTDYLSRDAFGVDLEGSEELCEPQGGLLGMLARAEDRAEEENEEQEGDEPSEIEQLPDEFAEDPEGTYEEVMETDELPEARYAYGVAAPFEGITPLGMRRPIDIDVAESADATTLLALDHAEGRPVGVRVDIGQGSVIVIASASLFANRDLSEEGGGVLFARLVREHARRGPVMFDEYHLGVGQRRSMMRYLRQAGAGSVVVQVLLLIAFLIWRVGARFGATRREPAPEPAGTASYVDGVATLYAKAKDPAGSARIVIRRALSRIAAHHHLGTAEPARMIELLEQRRRQAAAVAVERLSARLDEVEVGAKNLARVVEEVDRLVAAANANRA